MVQGRKLVAPGQKFVVEGKADNLWLKAKRPTTFPGTTKVCLALNHEDSRFKAKTCLEPRSIGGSRPKTNPGSTPNLALNHEGFSLNHEGLALSHEFEPRILRGSRPVLGRRASRPAFRVSWPQGLEFGFQSLKAWGLEFQGLKV